MQKKTEIELKMLTIYFKNEKLKVDENKGKRMKENIQVGRFLLK